MACGAVKLGGKRHHTAYWRTLPICAARYARRSRRRARYARRVSQRRARYARILRGGCRGFGWCRVGVGCCRAWRCRVGVKGCQGLSGLSVCQDVCPLASAVGQCCRAVGLSGFGCCRVELSGGVGLSGLCRGEQPYFVVSGLHQGLTQTAAKSVEESNPNMHTLKYMRLKTSLTPRSSVRLRPFKARNSTGPRKLFDLHRKYPAKALPK